MLGSSLATYAGSFWEPVKQYLTIGEVAMVLGLSDDYVRSLVVLLLKQGILIGGSDVLEIPPRPDAKRKVRKQYRQFRIHRETGIERLKEHLRPRN